jgi:ribulose-bisphosphate carboxylase small chain
MTMDVSKFSVSLGAPPSRRLGTFSYLPPFKADEIGKQIDHMVSCGLETVIEHVEPARAGARFWHLWKLPLFGERSREVIEAELEACLTANPRDHIRLIGYDTKRQTQAVSFIVHRGAD